MTLFDVLMFIGAFGFGWGMAERSNRKDLHRLSDDIDRLMQKVRGRESA